MMDECEFSDECEDYDNECLPCEPILENEMQFCVRRGELKRIGIIKEYRNSPQFKKEYAKREELVEAINRMVWHEARSGIYNQVMNIIQTEGLEE